MAMGLLINQMPNLDAKMARTNSCQFPSLMLLLPATPFHAFLPLPPFRTLSAGQHRPYRSIVCMAHPRRVKMVAQQIRRELADMLLKDNFLQQAVLPEIALGADMYLSSLTTISDVEVSKDLQVAKVYVSVFGDDRGKEIVMEGLKAKTRYVRAELGKRLSLRLTPEIRFFLDESLERGSRVVAILDKLKGEGEKDGQVNSANEIVDDEAGHGMLQLPDVGMKLELVMGMRIVVDVLRMRI